MGRAEANFKKSRFVKIHGEKLPLTYAMKKYKLNYYMLTRHIVSRKKGFCGLPSTKAFIQHELDRIYERFPSAPSKDVLLTCKKTRTPFKSLVKSHNVTYNTINTLVVLHGITPKFEQIHPDTHKIITKKYLREHLKNGNSMAYVASLHEVSPSFVLQKAHSFGLYVPPSFTSIGETQVRTFVESLGLETTKHKKREYEIDVYIPSLKIGIEYNGVYWHTTFDRLYHQKKYLMARQDGIHLIQIWEDDWTYKQDLIQKKLRHVLGYVDGSEKVFARKTSIERIAGTELRDFYNTNHIQGWKSAKHNFILRYDEHIVAALSIQNNKIERYTTSRTVTGGFSKLLKHAMTELNLRTIETFADLCWTNHENNQYIKNGFEFIHLSKPNYFWTKGIKKYSRLKFQKHKLKNMKGYADEKSEREIMTENGYLQLFDAGNAKFIKTF